MTTIKQIERLKEKSGKASSEYYNAVRKLETDTLDRLIKDGLFKNKVFYIAAEKRLIYESGNVNNPLHADLAKVLDLTHTTIVHNIHKCVIVYENYRRVMLTVTRYTAKVDLPRDITGEEFETVIKLLQIDTVNVYGLTHEISSCEKKLNSLLAMEEVVDKLKLKKKKYLAP